MTDKDMQGSDDVRAAIEAYKLAFPQKSPVISLRILTDKQSLKDGDIQLFLSDPKNPGQYACGTGWSVSEASSNLRKHLQGRLVALADEQAKTLLGIVASMEADQKRFHDAAKLAWIEAVP